MDYSFAKLLVLLVTSILTNNFIFSRFLGCCPFLGVSKKRKTAIGMGTAVIFVITLSSIVTGLLYEHLLVRYDITYLKTIVFILCKITLSPEFSISKKVSLM